MDEENGNSKSPLLSKKFLAYLIAELTWKAVLILVLFWGKDSIPQQVWAIMIAIILVAGFVETGYIIGQAALDKYIQVAQIVASTGKEVSVKGMTVGAKKDDSEKSGVE